MWRHFNSLERGDSVSYPTREEKFRKKKKN